MALQASVITDWQALQGLSTEWNDLLKRSASDTVFLTWEWISAWLTSVAPNAPLLTVIVRDEAGKLSAIAPFYLTRMRLLGVLPFRVCRVLGDCYSGSEYPDVITDRANEGEALEAVMKALLDRRELWDCIWMPQMAGWTGAFTRMTTCCRNLGLKCHLRDRRFSVVRLPPTYAAYLASLSSKFRYNVRRRTKELQRAHRVELVRCEQPGDLPKFLEALFDLHRRRWRAAGQSGSFVRRPRMVDFYERFAPVALRQGWLRLYGLKIDGGIRAVRYGLAYKGTLLGLQSGFDIESIEGGGNILLGMVLEASIQEGLSAYDFLGDCADYKRRWGAAKRDGCDLFIGRPSLKNRLLFYKEVWPTGRFLIEDHPAGRSCQ